MIRLRRDDFEDPHELAKYAATCGMSLQQFRAEFEDLIRAEPPPLRFDGLPGREARSDHSAPPSP
jgi:6-phosphofructokinase 1